MTPPNLEIISILPEFTESMTYCNAARLPAFTGGSPVDLNVYPFNTKLVAHQKSRWGRGSTVELEMALGDLSNLAM